MVAAADLFVTNWRVTAAAYSEVLPRPDGVAARWHHAEPAGVIASAPPRFSSALRFAASIVPVTTICELVISKPAYYEPSPGQVRAESDRGGNRRTHTVAAPEDRFNGRPHLSGPAAEPNGW